MAQAHGDRLTAMDASFLAQEGPTSHMHVGAVMIFEGPPPALRRLRQPGPRRGCTSSRATARSSRSRRSRPGRPVWIDDPSFNLEYHVRHTALPSPGSEEQLRALAARIHSQQLDRAKPLWETWLVQGLEGDRFALISKTHHALVDGVAGVDLATVLFDLEPMPAEAAARGRAVAPAARADRRSTSPRAASAGSCARRSSWPARAASAATRPARRSTTTREALEGVGEIAWAALNPAPETPLNVEIGPHRRVVFVRDELDDFKLVKNAFGGTVNDVVLTVVAGGLRQWLRSRGVRTEGLELRALVPVSIRARGRARRARQPDRRDARAAAGLRRGPGRAPARRARRRWTGSRSPSRRSAPRCSPACRTSRRRRSSRRPRG